jgi:hypothetical protein
MDTLGRKIVIILLLALAAGPIYAQKRNATYKNGELATVGTMSVVLDRFGISPKEFTMPVGAFLLVIRNRVRDNVEHFSLTLDSPNAPEIYSIDTTAEKFHGAVLVDLKPGKYRLRLTKSPELSVAITIE